MCTLPPCFPPPSVLLCLARNDYSGAHATASSLFASHPYDARVVNNYAVCALYVNQIQAGVAALEALIRKDPIAYGHTGDTMK